MDKAAVPEQMEPGLISVTRRHIKRCQGLDQLQKTDLKQMPQGCYWNFYQSFM